MSDKKKCGYGVNKIIPPTTEGKCPYCHEHVKSLENHIHDKHKHEKPMLKK